MEVFVRKIPKCKECPMLINLANNSSSRKDLMCCLNRTAYCNDYYDEEKVERNFKLACPLKSLEKQNEKLLVDFMKKTIEDIKE